MDEKNLRSALIHLANENPSLRSDLLPILKKVANDDADLLVNEMAKAANGKLSKEVFDLFSHAHRQLIHIGHPENKDLIPVQKALKDFVDCYADLLEKFKLAKEAILDYRYRHPRG